MIRVINTTPASVTFDIDDGGRYETLKPYTLQVGDRRIKDSRSIVTVFGLEAGRSYDASVIFDGESGAAPEFKCSFAAPAITVTCNVRDFGAYGDGEHEDTSFIQSAIMCCPEGGRVLIPAGTYFHRGIYLKSDIFIEIEKGAKLVLDPERSDIPRFPGRLEGSSGADGYFLGTWEGEPVSMFNGSVSGVHVKNVCVYGEGTIDGGANKENWWKDPKVINIAARPRLIFLKGCENVTFTGITLSNSPAWTVHPFFSKKLGFYNITIKNPWDSPNTDGINPESCDGVEIAGVHFSLGDDCIAVKSGKIDMGRLYKTPSKNIHIYGCLMEDGHGAVTVGSEAAAGVRELVVERCRFVRTDRGLRIKTRRGRGKDSVMDNIIFRDIEMDGVITPFVVNSFYFCDKDGKTDYVQDRDPLPVDDRTPFVKRLVFERITAVNSHYAAGWIEGLPEQPIEEIVLKDIEVSFAADAKKGAPAMALNVPECCREGFIVKNCTNFVQENVVIHRD
ncbi:MAG: glycoside hydrolase family 28 protein [Lachnospiraceae bacterium]|nr:glycoside hydrolase family 28 protein [Lachnospiraceae bacterium]